MVVTRDAEVGGGGDGVGGSSGSLGATTIPYCTRYALLADDPTRTHRRSDMRPTLAWSPTHTIGIVAFGGRAWKKGVASASCDRDGSDCGDNGGLVRGGDGTIWVF